MIFLLPFLDVMRKSMLTVPFLAQLDCGILFLCNDDELFFVVWLTDERRLVLFPAGAIVRDPHYCESPTRRKQGLNLRRT